MHFGNNMKQYVYFIHDSITVPNYTNFSEGMKYEMPSRHGMKGTYTYSYIRQGV